MSEQWLRAWGVLICVLLGIGVFTGTLIMITAPRHDFSGWIGVLLDAALLVIMWESVKKIGRE